MKKLLFLMTLFFVTILSADYLDVKLSTKSNYRFEDYLFKDINKTTTNKLEKKLSYEELHIEGSFNSIVGFNYYKNNIETPDSFDSKEIYIGSDKTKFLGYQKDETTINYGARKNTIETTKYTVYDILTIEKSKLNSIATETFDPTSDLTVPQTGTVTRKYDFEKITLSSENLYKHVKENAMDGENYFYGVAISQNFNSMFRFYGVIIGSYEQHDYSNGTANYTDVNGTAKSIFYPDETNGNVGKLLPIDGRFRGYGYGYKLTAEAYWKDISLFVTSYYKKTQLKNYHSGIRDAAADAETLVNVIATEKLDYLQQYTSFGLRYRF